MTYSDKEFHAISAVTGGVLGNEVVRAIARDADPLRNVFMYSLFEGLARAIATSE